MNELAILTKAMIEERKDIALAIIGGFIAGIAGVCLFHLADTSFRRRFCPAALYLDCVDVSGENSWSPACGQPLCRTLVFPSGDVFSAQPFANIFLTSLFR